MASKFSMSKSTRRIKSSAVSLATRWLSLVSKMSWMKPMWLLSKVASLSIKNTASRTFLDIRPCVLVLGQILFWVKLPSQASSFNKASQPLMEP